MNFKKTGFILLFLVIFNLSFSQNKWNIILGNWQDLSDYKDKSIGIMLKKSILSQLEKEKDFEVIEVKEKNLFFDSTSQAHLYCISNKADIIVYGFYYVEGKSLFVISKVWDPLKKQLKMRNEATGVVTIDIFDTIDEIAMNIKSKIREVLPALTLEEEVEIKKLRQTIYEKEEIKIERLFYTKFGFNVEMGHKILKSATTYNMNLPTQWEVQEGSFPEVFSILGFAIRIWDIRFDISGGSLPGFPVYRIDENKIMDTSRYNLINLYLSYYLPFWKKFFALGAGINISNLKDNDFETVPLSFVLFSNPFKNLELSFSLHPLFNESKYESDIGNGYKRYEEFKVDVPLFSISSIYFFSNELGIEGKFTYVKKEYERGIILLPSEKFVERENHINIMSFYLGLVYRADFLETEREKNK